MAVSFTWTIERLECRPQVGELENVVSKIHWRIFGFEGEVQESVYGLADVQLDEEVVFTPFDELTEDTVVPWMQDKLGIDRVDGLKNSLTQTVNQRINRPVVPILLPWMAS
jgi:hypothetical protein